MVTALSGHAAPPTDAKIPVVPAGARQALHLDLEPPSLPLTSTGYALGSGHFASLERFRAVSTVSATSGEPAAHFAIDAPRAPDGGIAAELAQRFRREGLPIARLWQNHEAMLSVGLNQRGKPGLWLVQKTR
jgi:hypothetical protein